MKRTHWTQYSSIIRGIRGPTHKSGRDSSLVQALSGSTAASSTELPPEIVHRIVNEVAALASSPISISEAASMSNANNPVSIATLKACSLVSRSFYFEARRHLFNYVALHFGQVSDCQQRAARDFKAMTRNRVGDNLVTLIRFLKITISPNSSAPIRMPGPVQGKLYGFLERAGMIEDNISKILDLMASCDSLEAFDLHQQPIGHFVWDDEYNPYILRICSGPVLQSVYFKGIKNLSNAILFAIFSSTNIREITLANMHWGADEVDSSSDPLLPHSRIISQIEKLRIVSTSYVRLVKALGARHFVPASMAPLSSIIAFPHLRVLKLQLPTGRPEEHSCVRKLILHAASTLESLELCFEWPLGRLFSHLSRSYSDN